MVYDPFGISFERNQYWRNGLLDKWNEFFTLYNEGLAKAYDKAMGNILDETQMRNPDFQEQLRNQVLNSMQSWYKQPAESLDNQTPEFMIDKIGTLEETISRIKSAAVFCDDDIPEYLKIKLGSFGEKAIPSLMQIAMLPSWQGDYNQEEPPTEDILVAAVSLKILGEWQAQEPLEAIITKFIDTGTPNELIADAFKIYISGVGAPAIPWLMKALSDACKENDPLTGAYEYTIIALTLVSQESKPEGAFTCLRTCFRTMQHKVIGAICIGDYGDPRGIAVLKGHLDRNTGRFDRQEFYEILSSIKRLGGTTNDIHDPFRDFATR